ncbi:MAG: 4-demethylwyosine synthase TYW1 [Candidatus Nitrosocaldaceae archaeon]
MSCSGEEFNDILQIKPRIMMQLKKAKYGVYNHSTVELCHWSKKSFLNEGECYKSKFYGIDTHRCMEFSPMGMVCENRCVYCWRPMEFYDFLNINEKSVDEPKTIYDNLVDERKRLISGYFGNDKADKKKVHEALLPTHYAISLSGEPTLYPKLPELIRYLKSLKDTRSIFLVTNGQEPEMLYKLQEEDALPTQLYLSTNAPNKDLFMMINKPLYKDAWERWNKSLEFLRVAKTRTVIRITLIKGYNDALELIKDYASLLMKGEPHFVEVKSYMHVGKSRMRLDEDDMLSMEEIKRFAKELATYLDFDIMDESIESRIVVLQNKKRYVNRMIS